MKKQFMSILLAVVMLTSSVDVTAFAAEVSAADTEASGGVDYAETDTQEESDAAPDTENPTVETGQEVTEEEPGDAPEEEPAETPETETQTEEVEKPAGSVEEKEAAEDDAAGEAESEEEAEETLDTYDDTTSDGVIANGTVSGNYGRITWEIDTDGKLTVEGEGDFENPDGSVLYRTAPWYDYRTNIKSAVIKVSEMKNASYMFYNCKNLAEMDLSQFDTSNVESMVNMFYGCSSLSKLDLSSFNTSKVTSMAYMFNMCVGLSELDISGFNTSEVTSMAYMFDGCSSLSSLDLSKFNTSKVTSMAYMFYNCSSLSSLDLSSFNTSKVTSMAYMFFDCMNLGSLDLSGFSTSNVTNMDSMFKVCSSLSELDISGFDTSKVTSMASMFSECTTLSELDISKFDTSKVTSMSQMFSGCRGLSSLDLSKFDTSEVTDMSYMFESCSGLNSLEISKFDTSKVENMAGMFSFCYGLSSLNISKFNTSEVTSMAYMFYVCYGLSSLDLSKFDTSKVTDMSYMFGSCYGLSSLDLSSLDTSKVENMANMFYQCWDLTTLGCSFDMGKVSSAEYFIDDCPALTTIYAPLNLSISISLPFTMYDDDENEYTSLPLNKKVSIALYKDLGSKSLRLKSVLYQYGFQEVDILKEAYSIDAGHGAFSLTCKCADPDSVSRYVLYAGNAFIASSDSGEFQNVNPQNLKGENLYIKVVGTDRTNIRRRIFLSVVPKPAITCSVGLLDTLFSCTLDNDVPIIGGDSFKLSLPSLPVNAVYEDGKLRIGINIREAELHSYNSDEGNTTPSKEEGFWKKKFEDLDDYIDDLDKTEDIMKDVKGYMQTENFAANIPGIEKEIDLEVIGYIEADWSDSLEKVEGQIIAQFTATRFKQKQLKVLSIPVTVNYEFTAEGGITGTVGFNFVDAKWYGDASFSGKIAIEPYAGVGIATYASVGVYGTAESGVDITIFSRNEEGGPDIWYLSGEAGVKAYFAKEELGKLSLISTEDLHKTRFADYVNDEGQLILLSNSGKSLLGDSGKTAASYRSSYASAASLYDEEYLEEAAEWDESGEAVAYAAADADGTLIKVDYGAASPQIATAGGKTVLFYIDNDIDRATPNQTVLKYMIYDDATESWEEPVTADNDGTADFNPVVCPDGKGNIYVAYLNSSKEYKAGEDPELADYAGTFGVSVLKFDTAEGKVTDVWKVNSDKCYCYAPRLAMTDGGLCVAWAENADNSVFGTAQAEETDGSVSGTAQAEGANSVLYSTLGDEGFGEPAIVASGLYSVTSLAVGKNGKEDSIAYAVDADNNLETTAQEVYLGALSGYPVKCTEGEVGNLQFAKLPGMAAPALACTADGSLAYFSGTSMVPLTEEGMLNYASDFAVCGDSVLFLKNQDGKRNVMMAAYDKEDGTWNTVAVTEEDDYVDSFSYDGGMLTYLSTEAKYNEESSEWETSSAVKVLDGIERHDIALLGADFEPEKVKAGGTLPVTLTVRNEGTETEQGVTVSVKKSDASDGSGQTFTLDDKFAPGGTKEWTVNLDLPDSIDASCIYTITAEPKETDADSSDNTYEIDLSLTDLSMSTALIMEVSSNDIDITPTLQMTVKNESAVPAESVTVTVKDASGNDISAEVTMKDGDGNDTAVPEQVTIDAWDEKIYSVDLTKHLPEDGTDVIFTADVSANTPEEYYYSNNTDDKAAFLPVGDIETETSGEGLDVSGFKESGYEYTGSEIRPALSVSMDGEMLTEGADYTVSYENNVNVYQSGEKDNDFDKAKAPKAVVNVTVDGETTTETRYFKIVPRDIGGSGITCPDIEAYEKEAGEDGKVQQQKPEPEISYNGTTLEKDKDYTLEYPDGEDAYRTEGTYNILIEGIGNYTGSRYALFTIRHTHAYEGDYQRDGDGHWRVCGCGETEEKKEHAYGYWTVAKSATVTESGLMSRKCSVCGYEDVKVIPVGNNEAVLGDVSAGDVPASGVIPDELWIVGISGNDFYYTGSAVKPDVRVYDHMTLLTAGKDYTISYTRNKNAYSYREGEEGYSASKAPTVTVKGKGNYSGTIVETFAIKPREISAEGKVTAPDIMLAYNKKVQKGTTKVTYDLDGKTVTLKSGTDFTYQYPGTDAKADGYNPDAFKEAGTYTVELVGKGNYTGTLKITETITTKTLITKASVAKIANQPYTGKEITLGDKLKLTYGGKELAGISAEDYGVLDEKGKADYDYTYEYSNNIDVGTAQILITGVNGYAGTRTVTFKITGKALKNAKFHSDLTGSYGWDNGEAILPLTEAMAAAKEAADAALTYKNNNAYEPLMGISSEEYDKLEDSETKRQYDYTYEYDGDTKNVGTVKIILTGINAYTGTVTKSYKITGVPVSKLTVTGYRSSYVYTGKEIKPAGEEEGSSDTGTSFRVYIKKTNTTPEVPLTKGENYTVSYLNNVNKGTATIVIKGINNYTGTLKKTFKITAYNIGGTDAASRITVGEIKEQPYTKGGVKPAVTVTDSATGTTLTLKQGTDYTLSYANNKKVAGAADAKPPTVTITGKGNYTGSYKKVFTIVEGSLDNTSITVSDVVYKENKANIYKPSVTLKDNTTGAKLAAGTDYKKTMTYAYAADTTVQVAEKENGKTVYVKAERTAGAEVQGTDIIPIGTVIKVTVTGAGYYGGEKTAEYRFVTADLSKASVTVAAQAYTGKAVEPDKADITVKSGKTVIAASQYEIVGYENNVNKGTGRLTIRGIGDYGGEKTVKFTITARSMNYTIIYDKNADDATGTMKNSSTPTGTKLTANAYKRKGYTFAGWNTKKDGTGYPYNNKETFRLKGILQVFSSKETLYAQWEKVSYTITYKLNDGKNADGNPDTYTIEDTVALQNPTRDGYDFGGWYLDSKFTASKKVEAIAGSTGNKTLYAKWVKQK